MGLQRVAIFTDSYDPSWNGVTVAVRQLETQLVALGYDVLVVAPSPGDPKRSQCSPSQGLFLPSVRLPGLHPRVATGWRLRHGFRILDALQPDVVHVHGFGLVSLLGVYLATTRQIPLVVTWHTDLQAYVRYYYLSFAPLVLLYGVAVSLACKVDMGEWWRTVVTTLKSRPSTWVDAAVTRSARMILEAAELVIAPSLKVAERISATAPAAKVTIVPTGVDPLPLPSHSAGATSVSGIHGSPLLLYIGRLAAEKNLDLLLAAFYQFREARPNATLVLVGDRLASRKLSRSIAQAIRRGVVVVGEVPRTELARYYSMADMFVFPSETDTQALVLHEAAHAGLPIITVDKRLTAVVRHGQNGWISDPTVEALTKAMMRFSDLMENNAFRASARITGTVLAGQFREATQSLAVSQHYQALINNNVT